MTHLDARYTQKSLPLIAALAILLLLLPSALLAQSTVSTGNINGTVTDPSGAAVAGAKVTITRTDTGVETNATTNSSGAYNSGSITAGNYTVKVQAKGFSTAETAVAVQIGNNSAVNFKLQ